MVAIGELTEAYRHVRRDRAFQRELARLLREYAGRPTPLYLARNLTERAGGARIYLKREDLAHLYMRGVIDTVEENMAVAEEDE